MIFSIALYSSLTVFAAGTLYRVCQWLAIRIGPEAAGITTGRRAASAARGILSALFGRRVLTLARVLVLDVILQVRTLREDFTRWVMHICIYHGFVGLVAMHALAKVITGPFFDYFVSGIEYQPTLNPFLFLRDLFAAIVLLGIFMALCRRFVMKRRRPATNAMDVYAIVIVAVMIISGILLEGVKITSHKAYKRMEAQYAGMEDKGLEAYWVKEFGVVSPDVREPFDPESLAWGAELNETCASCHSRPQWALLGYGTARALTPAALDLDAADASGILLIIHWMACFIGLAYLPFSKMFHIISTPVSLLADGGRDPASTDPANTVTRRALALAACTHCGECSLRCSVEPVFRVTKNHDVLPSEKLASLRTIATGRAPGAEQLRDFTEGSFTCTECLRCTTVCPAGIDLQDLWQASRDDLAAGGHGEPHTWIRKANTVEWASSLDDLQPSPSTGEGPRRKSPGLADRTGSFSACVQCQTCTNVCPVVAYAEDPERDIGMAPQQIMNLLRVGLKEMALGSTMVWDCVTCYQCQEHCPEGIRVADILYELRNLACERLGGADPVVAGKRKTDLDERKP